MYKIYVDMDGVLADFDRQFWTLFDERSDVFEEKNGEKAFWDKVYSNPEFFKNLPPFHYTYKFWEEIKARSQHVMILSSPSKRNTLVCKEHKRSWLQKQLGDLDGTPPYIFESKKYIYACPKSILIDDYEKKIKDWRKAGGIGILHNSKEPDATIEELDRILCLNPL